MMSERERDERDEYRADAAWEAAQEERYWNCEHENWSITDEGIVDVVSWENGHQPLSPQGTIRKKLDEPIAYIEVECDDCGRTNYLKVPYSRILELLRGVDWSNDGIDEGGRSEC